LNTKDIRLLYDYNHWANTRILDAVSALTVEQFTQDLPSSYRSVRDTLTHIMSAEWIWLERWQGLSPIAMINPADFPDLDALKTKWTEVQREQTDFIQDVTDESLTNVIAYVNTSGETWRYPLGLMMQHLVNHSSYHRGQLITILRQLGAEPVATDFLMFLDVKSEGGERNE